MKLVICGGVHGVGKTTLMERAIAFARLGIVRYDPGELFIRHLYRQKDKTAEEVEEMVTEQLVRRIRSFPLILSNWHYAVWTPLGYVSQLSMDRWERIVRDVSGAQITIALVTAKSEVILERREKDRNIRRRKLDLDAVREEIRETARRYEELVERTRLYVEPKRVIIENSSLNVATQALLAICRSNI